MNNSAAKPVPPEPAAPAAEGNAFVAALRGAAPYVHAHNGRVFVVG